MFISKQQHNDSIEVLDTTIFKVHETIVSFETMMVLLMETNCFHSNSDGIGGNSPQSIGNLIVSLFCSSLHSLVEWLIHIEDCLTQIENCQNHVLNGVVIDHLCYHIYKLVTNFSRAGTRYQYRMLFEFLIVFRGYLKKSNKRLCISVR